MRTVTIYYRLRTGLLYDFHIVLVLEYNSRNHDNLIMITRFLRVKINKDALHSYLLGCKMTTTNFFLMWEWQRYSSNQPKLESTSLFDFVFFSVTTNMWSSLCLFTDDFCHLLKRKDVGSFFFFIIKPIYFIFTLNSFQIYLKPICLFLFLYDCSAYFFQKLKALCRAINLLPSPFNLLMSLQIQWA